MALNDFSASPFKSNGGTDVRPEESQEGRITAYVVLSSIVAASGGILFGYDIGISGGVSATASFLKGFFPHVYRQMQSDTHISNYCKFNSAILTTFTSSLYIAGFFSSLLASRITERYGHRASMLAGGFLFLAGSAIGGAAMNVYMLILGRILLGAGIGFTNQSIPVYLSEMSPAKYRGALTGGFDICVNFGVLVATLVNYGTQKIRGGWGWRISLSLAAVPASLLVFGVLFLPDTPTSILRRHGDLKEARLVLQKIRGASADVEGELESLSAVTAEAAALAAAESPFRRILRRRYRPHLAIGLLLPLLQQATGINVVNFYTPVMFRTIGQKESASLMSAVITRSISLSCVVVASLWLVDRLGRRPLFLFGGTVMGVAHVLLGLLLAELMHDQHGAVSRSGTYLILAVLCVFMGGFSLSWGPLTWLVTSEIFPLEIRSAGQSVQVAVSFLSTFVIAQCLLAMLCTLRFGTFFLFAALVLVMMVLVFFFMPETKGVPLHRVARIWEQHWYWKRFVVPATVDQLENLMKQQNL